MAHSFVEFVLHDIPIRISGHALNWHPLPAQAAHAFRISTSINLNHIRTPCVLELLVALIHRIIAVGVVFGLGSSPVRTRECIVRASGTQVAAVEADARSMCGRRRDVLAGFEGERTGSHGS